MIFARPDNNDSAAASGATEPPQRRETQAVRDRDQQDLSEDLAKIRHDIVLLRRRLKINARKSKKLSSDTEILLKKVVKPPER